MTHIKLTYGTLLILLIFTGLSLRGVKAQDETAWDVLASVNAQRTANEIVPLAMNALLVEAAQRHSDDMAEHDFLGHQGTDGTWPADRVSATGYSWSRVGENALYRWDLRAEGVFEQWWSSPGHRDNMLNPAYLEIGVAWAQAADGKYYFTMVLAAPTGGVAASMTEEPVESPATNTPTITATSVQPRATNTPPPTLFATRTAVVVAPSSTPEGFQEAPANVTVVTSVPGAGGGDAAPTRTPQLAPTIPYATLAPTEAVVDLRLVYDDNSFTLINLAGQAVDLSGLIFRGVNGELAAERWDTEFLSAPLSQFPNGDCVQAWDMDISTVLPVVDGCETRHGWLAVNEAAIFWRGEGAQTFFVSRDGVTIAACEVWRGVCDVDLSARVRVDGGNGGAPTLTSTPVSQADVITGSNGPDVTLFYDEESFSLVNTAGQALNLGGLGFSSEAGSLSISAWDNGFLSASLNQFPVNDCLQAWDVNTQLRPAPDICETRHAWIAVNDQGDFWREPFSVTRDGVTLVTCNAGDAVCTFDLP